MRVLGRSGSADRTRPTGHLGQYLARDGSTAGAVGLDLDRPHVTLVVGKRGYGKSYTLGVIAEALSDSPGVTPIVADPMGVLRGLTNEPAGIPARDPSLSAAEIRPDLWCQMVGLSGETAAGAMLWQAAERAETIGGMRSVLDDVGTGNAPERTARNHLSIADRWDVFGGEDEEPSEAGALVNLSGLGSAPTNAVVAGLATGAFERASADENLPLPWLLVDEAHVVLDGIARESLERLATRGRQPGVSLTVATQRPSALTDTVRSQADLIVAHRLTNKRDLAALESIQPSYLSGDLSRRLPHDPGEVLVVDDRTETIHTVRIRERHTPHRGASPRASQSSK